MEISLLLHLHFDSGHKGSCTTPPGHVLHYLTRGRYELSINQHQYTAQAGDFIIYHDVEQVEWIENTVPVDFYSIVFQAPQLPALDFTQRVQASPHNYRKQCHQCFDEIHKNPAQLFGLFSLLQSMLSDLYRNYQTPSVHTEAAAWSQLEQTLRRQQLFRPSLQQCAHISGLSTATLNRYCRHLHDCSPLKRIQFIRMQHAQSLLRLSTMNISQIAQHLGYPRVHEFSRECKQQLGASPRGLRHAMRAKPDTPLGVQ